LWPVERRILHPGTVRSVVWRLAKHIPAVLNSENFAQLQRFSYTPQWSGSKNQQIARINGVPQSTLPSMSVPDKYSSGFRVS
jgi:hypothetical protein